MKVYITHYKDGYGDQEIDKIFSTKEKAIDHIIKEWLITDPHFYKGIRHEALIECAAKHVLEHELE
jgi:hypothetical protein